MRTGLEGDLLALEVAEATTVGRAATAAAATATTTTVTETATASTTSTTTAATVTETATSATTSTATASTEATGAARVVPLGSVVEADVAALNVGTVHSLKSSLGLIDGTELNVTVTLRGTGLTVGWETDGVDGTVLLEVLGDGVLVSVEGDVADEQGVAWLLSLSIAERASTALDLAVVVALVWARLAEVDPQVAVVKLSTLLGVESLGSGVDVGKLDVGEALRPASVGVGDDTARDHLAEALELAAEPLLINVPGETTNEEVLGWLAELAVVALSSLGADLDLGLLGNWASLSLSLALFGRLLLLLRGLLGVGVGAVVGRVIL